MELAAVHQAGDDLPCLKAHPRVARDDSIEVAGGIRRLLNLAPPAMNWSPRQRLNDGPADLQRVPVVLREVIADAGQACMKIRTAQLLGSDDFAGRGLDER